MRFTQEATQTEKVVAGVISSFFSCYFMFSWLSMQHFLKIHVDKSRR